MFGRKKKIKQVEHSEYGVKTIPEIFYGGKNPLIYTPEKKKNFSQQKDQKSAGVSVSKRRVSAVGPSPRRFSSMLGRKKMFGIAIFLFILTVSGISWYYIRDAGQLSGAIVVPEPTAPEESTVDVDSPAETDVDVPLIDSSEEILAEEETVEIEPLPLEFPRILLVDTPDIDVDALTDIEEELFGTDSGIWDTDSDGYNDGLEVVNLYNPKGIAPQRLVDSGLVKEYIHPTLQYRVYYPLSWEVGSVDQQALQVLISSITGDFIELRAFELDKVTTFQAWFGQYAVGQKFLDLEAKTNRFQEKGYVRKDGLVAYFITNKVAYVFVYHPGTAGKIPYRHVMEMAIASFRPNKTQIDIPEQVILPAPATIN